MPNNEDRKPRKQPRPGSPRIVVEVTKEIIERAEQRDSSHCMLAEALKAAVPGAQRVSVDLQTIRYTDPQRRLRFVFLTPRQGQLALVGFDQGMHTDPFTMHLRGAQVVKVGDPNKPRPPSTTPPMPEGGQVEFRQGTGRAPTAIPEIVGGRTPPRGALSNITNRGKRRAFGLRGLKY